MSKQIISLLFLLLGTAVVFLLISIPVFIWGNTKLFYSIVIGYGLSVVNIVSGYLSIRWGFNKSLTIFLGVVLGGMALRFSIIGVFLFWLTLYTDLSVLGFLASFMLFYIFFQYHEISFINRELKAKS